MSEPNENSLPPGARKLLPKEGAHEVTSIVAYLIGVPKRIFENDFEPLELDVFTSLEKNKNARIIRHLCILRTSIERNYKYINQEMKFNYKSLLSLTEYVPYDSINQLSIDGISFIKNTSTEPRHHIIEINRIISDRINNCKDLFPIWLNWQYLRELFVMPNGLTEQGTKIAADTFYSNMSYYPYQMYINWEPRDTGNILYNDMKFVTLLYELHNDYFTDTSKISDAPSYVKSNIYDFIDDSSKLVMVVDCENSDPYKLCAVFKNLSTFYTYKISKIILFDDIHTVSAWRILEQYTQIPIEHITVERVKSSKSLVDIKLTVRACQEHYQNGVDSFIIVSSDSDYWGLISSLPTAHFLVMIEREKCGVDMKEAMLGSGIFYCYIDDFNARGADEIKAAALFRELNHRITQSLNLNMKQLLDSALLATRIEMNKVEYQQFFDRHIKPMDVSIGEDGIVRLELKR